MKKIILTGGGTAGHVTPNIALLPELKKEGYEILYIGSYTGIEKDLLEAENIPYQGIATGKFRRYLSLKNITDPFRVIKGFFQAKKIVRDFKPDAVFSKGGFVSVPVVWAARSFSRKLPIVIHESDMTPGLANKLCFKKANKICCNFPETLSYLPENKAVLSGSPIRRELLCGSAEEGFRFTGLDPKKPVLLMVGGSLGSAVINQCLRSILNDLSDKGIQVVHLCGKGKTDSGIDREGYVQYEYIREQMKDLFAMSDVVLSRAGANAICELLELNKPNILVPLSAAVSRGDQVLNAESYRKQGFSYVLEEESMTPESLLNAITEVFAQKEKYRATMAENHSVNGVTIVMNTLKELTES